MTQLPTVCLAGLVTLSLVFPISAAEPSHSPRVPAFERFFRSDDADLAAGGRLLAGELNCRSCHKAPAGRSPVADKQAPILDLVGDRVRPEWIRDFLNRPHAVKPGTTMPDLLGHLPPEERQAQVEALTHFLASTGNSYDTYSDPTAAKRGQDLFRRVGCAACHDVAPEEATPLATSAALPDLARKYTSHALATFLKDPLKVRPSGRMPALGLKDEEYQDLAQYFLRDRDAVPNVRFAVYQGSWEKLPDFSPLKPVKTGECAGFDLSVAGMTNNFAIRFETNLFIAAEADLQFTIGSDDGSRLLIDGEVAADADGIHPHQEDRRTRHLTAGWHAVVVEYFQGGGEWTLAVDMQGRGFARRAVASQCALRTDKPLSELGDHRFVVHQELAAKGRELFVSVGCANCHQLRWEERLLKPARQAKSWESLTANSGCLSPEPGASLPRFGFDERQIAALQAALKSPAPAADVAGTTHTTLMTLNCYGCHRRGDVGGVEEARNAFFLTRQPEMGDEGRIPPALTGVGDKLQDQWLKHVLEQGASDRKEYMQARMPRFGNRNIEALTAAFVELDRRPDSVPAAEFAIPDYRVKADGRHLVGAKALSCIKCHDFGPHPSQGVRAINLATMTTRLREDWFYRYVLDPQEYRPGTRMPSPWPFGQTTIRDVLNADVNLQIHAVWKYLSDGEKAALPLGLVREPIELVATDTPILYRNFIEGAGARAIGVGYPEKVNLAWDANQMRLALIWHGAFMDASRHWNGRGVGFEAPLGDHVLPLPDGPPLAKLSSASDSWPEGLARDQGFRFRGYRLDARQRPTFQFTAGDLKVDDRCVPQVAEGEADPGLQRQLTIQAPATSDAWYFRAAVAQNIRSTDRPGEWRIDQTWTLQLDPAVAASVRDVSGGRQELLIPLKINGEPQTLTLQYRW